MNWINETARDIKKKEAQEPSLPPGGGDSDSGRDRDKSYSGPCGNGGSSCRWPKR